MQIERVQVEEGFLDGLDVTFAHGLNVIVGERGTGKTSLIELVRFCLGVPGYTSDSTKRSRDHALSILGGGQVTVTLTDGVRKVSVTRTTSDEQPRASGSFVRPTILSQTEIETAGLRRKDGSSFSVSVAITGVPRIQAKCVLLQPRRTHSVAKSELERLALEIPALDKQTNSCRRRQLTKVSAEATQKKDLRRDLCRNCDVRRWRWRHRGISMYPAGGHARGPLFNPSLNLGRCRNDPLAECRAREPC